MISIVRKNDKMYQVTYYDNVADYATNKESTPEYWCANYKMAVEHARSTCSFGDPMIVINKVDTMFHADFYTVSLEGVSSLGIGIRCELLDEYNTEIYGSSWHDFSVESFQQRLNVMQLAKIMVDKEF